MDGTLYQAVNDLYSQMEQHDRILAEILQHLSMDESQLREVPEDDEELEGETQKLQD